MDSHVQFTGLIWQTCFASANKFNFHKVWWLGSGNNFMYREAEHWIHKVLCSYLFGLNCCHIALVKAKYSQLSIEYWGIFVSPVKHNQSKSIWFCTIKIHRTESILEIVNGIIKHHTPAYFPNFSRVHYKINVVNENLPKSPKKHQGSSTCFWLVNWKNYVHFHSYSI